MTDFDVLIIGGGPAGSAAAKKCAEGGLKALILERKKLPREKPCTGMIMKPWGQSIIPQEFGEIPNEVLVDPCYLSGYILYMPGVEPRRLVVRTPLTWRIDLDGWLSRKAREKGAELWDEAKAIAVTEEAGGYSIVVEKEGKRKLSAKFVIGADGGNSLVRRTLFPRLRQRTVATYRECYRGRLGLERDWTHWFHPLHRLSPRFDIIHKGDFFLLEGSSIRQFREEINRILIPYGFDPSQKPIWKDGCLNRMFYDELLSGSFIPGRGNVLLVGDAAGLGTPFSDGIGAALESGLCAASSVIRAIGEGKEAIDIYAAGLEPLIAWFRKLHSLVEGFTEEAAKGPQAAMDALMEVWGWSQLSS